MNPNSSGFTILCPTPEALRFIEEWNNEEAYVVAHTSGSTGKPKEIQLSKADMRISAQATNSFFGIDRSSTLLCPLSASYIAGKMMLVRAMEAGCTIIMCPPSNEPFSDWADELSAVSLACMVPSQLPSLLASTYSGPSIEKLIIGGAPLSPSMEQSMLDTPIDAYATYGMTETCSHVALRKLGQPFYQALPGINFTLDARGCLVIEAPQFSFGTLTTNDMVEPAETDSLGRFSTFRWLGRADNAINSGGVKFHPEELERLLEPYLRVPFFIHSIPHEKWGETVALTVEEGSGLTEAELFEVCRRVLPRYAQPKLITTLSSLPRTSSGKILRR